jgi:Flp pilus assembly protein TadG
MRKFVRNGRNFIGACNGSMTIEFVALVPMLVAALMIGFEFSRAFWAYDVVTRDVRAAVRFLSRANPYDAAAKTSATNVAKTGLPAGTTLHFPWTIDANVAYAETPFTSANYNVDGTVITATANVPITLSFLTVLNSLAGTSLGTTYTLVVSDQARWIGN